MGLVDLLGGIKRQPAVVLGQGMQPHLRDDNAHPGVGARELRGWTHPLGQIQGVNRGVGHSLRVFEEKVDFAKQLQQGGRLAELWALRFCGGDPPAGQDSVQGLSGDLGGEARHEAVPASRIGHPDQRKPSLDMLPALIQVAPVVVGLTQPAFQPDLLQERDQALGGLAHFGRRFFLDQGQRALKVGDGFFVGGDPERALPSKLQVPHSLPLHSGAPEVEGQLNSDFLDLIRVEVLERLPDGLVQVGSLHLAQAPVEVSAEKVVTEAKLGEPPLRRFTGFGFQDDAVLPVQFAAQTAYQPALVHAHHACDRLGGEDLPFHAGDCQRLPHFGVQLRDALFDHALDARRHEVQRQLRSLDPVPGIVLRQVAPFFHVSQQFKCKQRVAARDARHFLPEALPEAVGFGVHQGVDEFKVGLLTGAIQVHPDVAVGAFEFAQHVLEGMHGTVGAIKHALRAVRPQDQHRGAIQALPQMKQQASRGRIHPVKIVKDDQERVAPGELDQDVGVFLEDAVLMRRGFRAHSLLVCQQALQLRPPGPAVGVLGCKACDERSLGHKGAHQIGPALHEGLNGLRRDLPDSNRLIARDGAGTPARLHIACQHGQDLSERQEGIAHASVVVARAHGDDQLR